MSKFNHAMDLAFEVVTEYDDWYRCLQNEKGRVKQAILDRVEEIFSSNEYLEAISSFDSYELEDD